MLHIEVCHPVNVLGGLLNLRADGMQLCEVGAKHLDGNAGLCARQHGVDAVRYGLAYFDVDTRQCVQPLANVVHNLVLAALVQCKRHFHFAAVHPLCVFVKFGTPRFACHIAHLGYLQQQLLGLAPYAVALLKRYPGQCAHVDGERALVERRQE